MAPGFVVPGMTGLQAAALPGPAFSAPPGADPSALGAHRRRTHVSAPHRSTRAYPEAGCRKVKPACLPARPTNQPRPTLPERTGSRSQLQLFGRDAVLRRSAGGALAAGDAARAARVCRRAAADRDGAECGDVLLQRACRHRRHDCGARRGRTLCSASCPDREALRFQAVAAPLRAPGQGAARQCRPVLVTQSEGSGAQPSPCTCILGVRVT